MRLSDYRWRSGSEDVLGGMDCFWLSSEEHAAAQVRVYAYPESVVPTSVREALTPGCGLTDWGETECYASGVQGGTWLLVRIGGGDGSATDASVQQLYDHAASRLSQHPAAVPASRTAEWWSTVDCSAVSGRIDPTLLGFDRVEDPDSSGSQQSDVHPTSIPALNGVQTNCGLYFVSGSPEVTDGQTVSVDFVAGGAIAYDTARSADHAQQVVVEGAREAVLVPGNDRYEGSFDVLLVTDGVNVLAVFTDVSRPNDWFISLAAQIMAGM